jgi:hypothetical protein
MISPNHKDVVRCCIGVKVYDEHVAHYLQVSQVTPLPLTFVVNGFIILYSHLCTYNHFNFQPPIVHCSICYTS